MRAPARWLIGSCAGRGLKVLPMGLERYGEAMERRIDPRGRTYYWSKPDPATRHRVEPGTDVEGLAQGYATLTPLHLNLTEHKRLAEISAKQLELPE